MKQDIELLIKMYMVMKPVRPLCFMFLWSSDGAHAAFNSIPVILILWTNKNVTFIIWSQFVEGKQRMYTVRNQADPT